VDPGRSASKEVVLHLIKVRLPVLLYGHWSSSGKFSRLLHLH